MIKGEGEFVDNPNKPGGRTNKRIIRSSYNAYLPGKWLANKDVKLISNSEV